MNQTWADVGIDLPDNPGVETRTVCPQCSPGRRKQNEKCLAVNVEKQTWLCHHCGWSGGLSHKKDFFQQVAPTPKIYTRPKFKKTSLPKDAVKWFSKRNISVDVLDKNKISFGRTFMPQTGKDEPVIQFPYFRDGQIVNIKHRTFDKKFRMEKGAERILYGVDDINEFCTIIVEGEMDKLALHEAGFKNCVSVPDGAPPADAKNYSTKFSFLESDEEKISKVMRWIIASDNDSPGVRLKNELIRRFGAGKCWEAKWPNMCKDANDVLMLYGKEKLVECIDNAVPTPVEGIFNVSDFRNKVIEAYDHGVERGKSTGWKSMDEYYTVRPGEWTVVTGIPSSGKSEWLDALLVNLTSREGWVFGIFSAENLPLERHFQKLAEKYINLPFEHKAYIERMTMEQLDTALDWGEKHFHFMMPEPGKASVDNILDLSSVLCYRYGINGLIIDPWNELDHDRSSSMTETEYISMSLGKIRRFARNHGVHVWVVAHPTKMPREDGKYPVPTPYDISGSAHWRNKADNAITVHRPNPADKNDLNVEIYVQKIRFKEIGRIGKCVLKYDYISGRYNE